jgi:hypothetical protein
MIRPVGFAENRCRVHSLRLEKKTSGVVSNLPGSCQLTVIDPAL